MNIKVKLSVMAFLPERAHDTDAGADIRTPAGFTLKAHDSQIVATGVHVELPSGTVGMLKSKSGLNIKHGIISEGVIDEGFSGEIVVKLYNLSDHDHYSCAATKSPSSWSCPCTTSHTSRPTRFRAASAAMRATALPDARRWYG